MFLHNLSGNPTAQVRKNQSLTDSEAPVTVEPCPGGAADVSESREGLTVSLLTSPSYGS